MSRLTESERQRLLGLQGRLASRVVGQLEAVRAVADAILRSRSGLAPAHRPIGCFLFLGPTGTSLPHCCIQGHKTDMHSHAETRTYRHLPVASQVPFLFCLFMTSLPKTRHQTGLEVPRYRVI